jgi:hypothetical protein
MSMRKLFYMGLEAYEARYTLQLTEWNKRVFEKRGIDYVIVPGDNLDDSKAIVTGQVLDAHGRSYFGMSQIQNLVKMMRNGEVTHEDVIFFEDMFQPGMESLPYIMDQSPAEYKPRVYVRCLAQTIDPDDFVNVWGMTKWMRHYEMICDNFVDGILIASEEMASHLRISLFDSPLYVTGLPFGKSEVQERIPNIKPFNERAKRVVFAARWDQEKQPGFFMDLIEKYKADVDPDVEFAICSGGALRSNNPAYVTRAKELESKGLFKIYENLKKNDYYNILNDSRVLFNCALQDWVSNTVSEGDTLGCNVVYPAYRSFPEVFGNDGTRMYVPWSMEDAISKIKLWMEQPHPKQGIISDYQDGTIDRTVDVFLGKGSDYARNDSRYRDHVAPAKI